MKYDKPHYDVQYYADIYVQKYQEFDVDVFTKLDLDGNFGKALGSIYVKENDPKAGAWENPPKGHIVDKEGLDIVASELILDSSAVQGLGSAALTKATLLTDDHLTSGLAGAEALGTKTFAETDIDIDASDEYVNLGGLSASAVDGVGGGAAPAPEHFVSYHNYY